MRIGYRELEAVVRAVHGDGAKPTALLGRLKYLQRFDWPPGGAKGQGSRAGYGLEQVLAVMLAVELLEVGVSPLRTVRLLRTGWPETRAAMLIGWAAATSDVSPTFLALAPRALEELGVAEDIDRPSPDRLRPVEGATLDAWRDDFRSGPPALYVVDSRRIAMQIRDELGALGIARPEEVDQAFINLGEEVFKVGEPSVWSVETAAT